MRRLVVLVLSALLGAGSSIVLVGADSDRTITIRGDERFVANTIIQATFRFSPGPLVVKSGDAVTWTNPATPEPHSISIVNQGDLPASVEDVFMCSVCNDILTAHGIGPGGPGPSFTPVLGNAAAHQLQAVGDSFLIGSSSMPGFLPTSVTETITAQSGSTLFYLCAIHPWMQGTISVN